jgi:hypothetical protein
VDKLEPLTSGGLSSILSLASGAPAAPPMAVPWMCSTCSVILMPCSLYAVDSNSYRGELVQQDELAAALW